MKKLPLLLALSFCSLASSALAQNETALAAILKGEKLEVCDIRTDLGKQIIYLYGAVFASQGIKPPTSCIFTDAAAVQQFQDDLKRENLTETGKFQSNGSRKCSQGLSALSAMAPTEITLQTPALKALQAANAEVKNSIVICNSDNDAALRTYQQTVINWRDRVCRRAFAGHSINEKLEELKGLLGKSEKNCLDQGKFSKVSLKEILLVLEIEKDLKIYFGSDNKAILSSASAPGTSQHHSLLAVDIYLDGLGSRSKYIKVVNAMADNGWYRTVRNDVFHFTYLGIDKDKLARFGFTPFYPHGYVSIIK
jgi:hypothetical protein